MSEYHFWYKSSVIADNLEEAIKKEKKIKKVLASVEVIKESPENESMVNAIGFTIDKYDTE